MFCPSVALWWSWLGSNPLPRSGAHQTRWIGLKWFHACYRFIKPKCQVQCESMLINDSNHPARMPDGLPGSPWPTLNFCVKTNLRTFHQILWYYAFGLLFGRSWKCLHRGKNFQVGCLGYCTISTNVLCYKERSLQKKKYSNSKVREKI